MTFDGERNIQGDRGCNRRNEEHLRVRIRTPPSPHSSDNHSPTPFSALPSLCNQILVLLQINGAKWEGKKKITHTYICTDTDFIDSCVHPLDNETEVPVNH